MVNPLTMLRNRAIPFAEVPSIEMTAFPTDQHPGLAETLGGPISKEELAAQVARVLDEALAPDYSSVRQ